MKDFENEDLKTLSDLGLTNNQIRIYLALLKLGENSKATTIYELSSVPRQDVYRVLVELQELGIVEKIIEKPTKFRAIQPIKAVAIILKQKMCSLLELNKEAEIFAKRATVNYVAHVTSYSQEKDEFVIISGKQAIIQKTQEVMEETKCDIDSILPSSEFAPWAAALEESFNIAKNNRTKIRWIINSPDNLEQITEICNLVHKLRNHQISVKYIVDAPKIKAGIFDKKQAILATSFEGTFAERPAIWTNSPVVIALTRSYFETCWKAGICPKVKKVNPQKK